MLKKSLVTLKNNPMIIILLVLVIILSAVSVMFLMPDLNRIMEISNEISRNSANPAGINPQEMTEMLFSSMIMLLYSLVACGFGIVFMAGFGNMLAVAVNDGKASLKIFLFGIKKFFVKTLLSFLLAAAIVFGASIVISIISTPFTIAGIMRNAFDPEAMISMQRVMMVFSSIVMILLYPLVVLWLPAIFLDRNEGVLACFRNGFKAGVKKYIFLIMVIALILLPTIFLFIFTENVYSIMQSPFYFYMYIYQAIIMPVLLTYLFVLYNEMKKAKDLIKKDSMIRSE